MAQFWFQNVVSKGFPVVGIIFVRLLLYCSKVIGKSLKSYTNSLNIQLDLYKILQTQHQGFSKD